MERRGSASLATDRQPGHGVAEQSRASQGSATAGLAGTGLLCTGAA